jgi:photosynthetic reaction center H subunit
MLMEHFDLAFISLYVFWLFFAGLLFYLRREDRREGYPLELDTPGTYKNHGFIWIPPPKTFLLENGEKRQAPDFKPDTRPIAGRPVDPWPGAPLEPTGANPMLENIGPAAWAERADVPDMTEHGAVKIRPLRVLPEFFVFEGDADPRGYDVVGRDGKVGGRIVDLWVDQAEVMIRYLEVEVPNSAAAAAIADTEASGGEASGDAASAPARTRRVLMPMALSTVNRGKERVEVTCVFGAQLQNAPSTRSSDQVTLLEEDKIQAFFGSGYMFADPRNREPLL